MNTYDTVFLSAAVGGVVSIIFYSLTQKFRGPAPLIEPEPKIIVNMPADAKPIGQLTQPGDKVIGSDRAVLWWTVYSAALANNEYASDAADLADQAVNTCYGELTPYQLA